MKKNIMIGAGLLMMLCLGFAIMVTTNANQDDNPVIQKKVAEITQSDPLSTSGSSSNQGLTQSPKTSKSVTDTSAVADTIQPEESHDVVEEFDINDSQYGALPVALQGTNPHWNIKADKNGNLVVTADLRYMVEFFLSARSQEPEELLLDRVKEYLENTLPDSAANQALDIIGNYVEYREQETKFQPTVDFSTDPVGYLAELGTELNDRIQTRRQYLGEDVADIFYGREEAYDEFTVNRLQIEHGQGMSIEQRNAKIEALEEQLPEDMQERRRMYKEEFALKRKIKELQQSSGNEQEIYDLRADFYGPEAAEKLKELDQEHADFNRRLETFRKAKDEILANAVLDEVEKQRQIDQLESQTFTEQEKNRVSVMEMIRQHKKERKG